MAWLTLDAGDNDVMRFWRYVVAACQSLGASGAAGLLPGLQPPAIEPLLTALLNNLLGLPQRGVLVLEDYHTITSPGSRDAGLLQSSGCRRRCTC